jgi:hypothetical protein
VNRRDLEQHLRAHGCILHHHGSRHDIWLNLSTLAQAPVPRHRMLKRGTARGICRMLGVPLPPGL